MDDTSFICPGTPRWYQSYAEAFSHMKKRDISAVAEDSNPTATTKKQKREKCMTIVWDTAVSNDEENKRNTLCPLLSLDDKQSDIQLQVEDAPRKLGLHKSVLISLLGDSSVVAAIERWGKDKNEYAVTRDTLLNLFPPDKEVNDEKELWKTVWTYFGLFYGIVIEADNNGVVYRNRKDEVSISLWKRLVRLSNYNNDMSITHLLFSSMQLYSKGKDEAKFPLEILPEFGIFMNTIPKETTPQYYSLQSIVKRRILCCSDYSLITPDCLEWLLFHTKWDVGVVDMEQLFRQLIIMESRVYHSAPLGGLNGNATEMLKHLCIHIDERVWDIELYKHKTHLRFTDRPVRDTLGAVKRRLSYIWEDTFPALPAHLSSRLILVGSMIPMCIYHFGTFSKHASLHYNDASLDIFIPGPGVKKVLQEMLDYLKNRYGEEEAGISTVRNAPKCSSEHPVEYVAVVLKQQTLLGEASYLLVKFFYVKEADSVEPEEVTASTQEAGEQEHFYRQAADFVLRSYLCPTRAFYRPHSNDMWAFMSALSCWKLQYMSEYRSFVPASSTPSTDVVLKYVRRRFGVEEHLYNKIRDAVPPMVLHLLRNAGEVASSERKRLEAILCSHKARFQDADKEIERINRIAQLF